ncbi:energy-coupling factor ABC transporter ATP-binding protein [Halalkalibacterium halodurans]|uniref:energy-coupling factor ABC transporter ATP-binding protein n=1 Tax=Halalkalibacterium halodurans TaxID=86665 RepID=UPI001068845E|nr:energy-coupling factor ABC transporter ATP-binding protein [Halalkalibacterium halodurans]TES54918.1 energy-coupling factor ABC transporter ATP-binding protein [Halalkalibacterium halodurans]
MEIQVKQLEHRYMKGSPFEKVALSDVSFTIPSGSFTAIIGHTGSGKSTLAQHFNGLLRPSKGTVRLGELEITGDQKPPSLKEIRRKVGLVFQYPEHQLFEETVEKDICFGPMNYGVSEARAKKRAKELLHLVGLPDTYLQASPFSLSGGQMRRVAIAGVLAMEPDVLVLDEPTAGLDPEGQRLIMDMFYRLHQEKELTTVLVTHNMSDAAKFADQIIVMSQGNVAMTGDRQTVFARADELVALGLDVPETLQLLLQVKERFGLHDVPPLFSLEELADFLAKELQQKEGQPCSKI